MSTRYGAKTVRAHGIGFANGTGEVHLEISLSHGGGKREVDAACPLEDLTKLCDLMKQFDRDNRGHGFWHYENPDRAFPCSSCVLVGKRVVVCREGGCAEHKTGEDETCWRTEEAR